MLSLFSKIRQFLVMHNGDLVVSKKHFARITPVLGSSTGEVNVSTCQSPRPPGAARRSNRDRKSKSSQSVADTHYASQFEETESNTKQRIELEGAIRTTAHELPDEIKQSYLTLLEALLTMPQPNEQVERIKALQVAVLDASRRVDDRQR